MPETTAELIAQLKSLWFKLWGETMTKHDCGLLIHAPHPLFFKQTLWPGEFEKDIPARVRFLLEAVQIAKDFTVKHDMTVGCVAWWIFGGLFKGERWLYDATWGQAESSERFFRRNQGSMPKRFDNLILQMARRIENKEAQDGEQSE